MIINLRNHPSIVMWVPFNERWGQHETVQVGQAIENLDVTRLLNIASGGNFFPVGDIADRHNYREVQKMSAEELAELHNAAKF